MPESFTNGKATLLLQPIAAFKINVETARKKGQRNNFPFPKRVVFDTDRKPYSFSFSNLGIKIQSLYFLCIVVQCGGAKSESPCIMHTAKHVHLRLAIL